MSDVAEIEGLDSKFGILTDVGLLSIVGLSFIGLMGNRAVPPVLPDIGERFALTDAEIGYIMASFSFGTFATIPVTGVIADIYGRRTVALPSLFLFGTAGVGTLFVGSFEGLLVTRFLQGVAYAGTTPLSVALIGDLYSGPEGATAQGVRASANGWRKHRRPGNRGLPGRYRLVIPVSHLCARLPSHDHAVHVLFGTHREQQ